MVANVEEMGDIGQGYHGEFLEKEAALMTGYWTTDIQSKL